MAWYLGIDVGTSSVKVTAIDECGRVGATGSASYTLDEPAPGWRQIDPNVWWRSVCTACRELGSSIDLNAVASVGVTGQMHTIVLIDERGDAVRPSILWNDQRTLEDVPSAKAALEEENSSIARRISTGSPALTLMWLRKHEPEAFGRAKSMIGVPDWIAYRLGAHAAVDWCGASTSSLFDITSGSWSDSACAALGIPKSLLPCIEDADSLVGVVNKEAALQTGLPEGASIVRGTGDNPAAALPTGCLTQGNTVISLGTSGVLMYAQNEAFEPVVGKPVLFRANGVSRTLVQLSLRSCGSNREWFDRSILQSQNLNIDDPYVLDLEHDMRNILFYPHLNGEKVLHGDPSARGAFIGLDLDTTRSELRRAVMEGAAFALRSLREAVPGSSSWEEISVVGGGSKNDLWCNIVCNVLATRIVRLETSGAGQGAAMLALSMTTGEPLESIVDRSRRRIEVLEPLSATAHSYDKRYGKYCRIYDALKTVFEEPL